jgi:hypothetical protein
MKPNFFSTQRGQALIIISLAAIGLFAIVGLAVDGSAKFSDRRHAQNAADSAAYAGALARVSNDAQWKLVALDRALGNGYNNNLLNNTVTVYSCNETGANCGPYAGRADVIKVAVTSDVKTYFARVIGVLQMHNTVQALALAKQGYTGAPFSGNAIASLALSGNGFDAHGTPVWNITGGGVFVNSTSASAATCGGNAGVISPSVTAVGGTNLSCHTVTVGTTTTGATQLDYSDYSSIFPRRPTCNGVATKVSGQWRPQSGADGSQVVWNGDMDFAPGLYCVTNSPGNFHGNITGTGVTFYITRSNFSLRLNGGGTVSASAPTSGEYKGILLYLAPQVSGETLLNTQALDLRGNGSANIVGTIIAPSATVTMFGNSGTGAYNSQIIGYNVDTGGTADITINYNQNDNWIVDFPANVGLFQ